VVFLHDVIRRRDGRQKWDPSGKSPARMTVHGIIGKSSALTRRKYARLGEWSVGMIVEQRVGPTEPAQPPAEKRWHAQGNEAQRARRRRVRRQRPDRGALEDSAKGRAERLIPGTAVSIKAHERMNEADNREARTGRVADWGAATISIPTEDPAGEMQAAYRVRACCKLHAARRHMENIRAACCIEHVRSFEETRKGLAVPAVADETEAGIRRNLICDAAHMAAPAAKRDSIWVLNHRTSLVDPDTLTSIRKTGEHSSSMASVINEVAALMEVIWAGAERINFLMRLNSPNHTKSGPSGSGIFYTTSFAIATETKNGTRRENHRHGHVIGASAA
jgi:hypothetical protein